MNIISGMSKVPWKKVGKVAKIVGITGIVTHAAISTSETDENAQKMFVKLGSMLFKNKGES